MARSEGDSMAVSRWRSKKALVALGLLAVVLGGLGLAWLERAPLLAWYYLRGLAKAGDADRQRWAERVAGLGEPAVPGLIDLLAEPDPAVCANAQAGLACLAAAWGPDGPHSVELAHRLARAFPRLSAPGRKAALEVVTGWFAAEAATPGERLVAACARLLAESAGGDPEAQAAALELAAALLRQGQHAEALQAAREVVRGALRSPAPANRRRAIQLSLCEGMDLLEQVVGLLTDPVAEVRRAALLAVGPASDVVRDEGLLPSLHDPDPEARQLCEAILRGRGLRPIHLHLGRLLTHPQPVQRLRVLDHLTRAPDLDPGLWLRRLSHDPSPAVRTAALRAMSEERQLDLSDRIDQMARSDPSPTVSQLAVYYRRQTRAAWPR
jgi:hypothetical protein